MEEKLNQLIGKEYKYKDKLIIIKRWGIVNTNVIIYTDKQTYNFYESEIDEFINELQLIRVKLKEGVLEKRQNELKNMENTPNIRTVSNESTDLSVILLDTIQKVQKDKTYINQANAICNVVSQMINIKKLELLIKKK